MHAQTQHRHIFPLWCLRTFEQKGGSNSFLATIFIYSSSSIYVYYIMDARAWKVNKLYRTYMDSFGTGKGYTVRNLYKMSAILNMYYVCLYIFCVHHMHKNMSMHRANDPVFVDKNIYVLIFGVTGCTQFNASLSASHSFSSIASWSKSSNLTGRITTSQVQNIRFSGHRIYGCHCIPKPADHKAENRFESICQRISRLIRFRKV